MKKRGSIYDVARESGVSIGTISRVFNNKPDVAEETRVLVLKAAKKVQYMPRISTRRINIGLVVQQIEKVSQVGFISDSVSILAKHTALREAVLEIVPIHDMDVVYRNYIRGLIAVTFGEDQKALKNIKHIPVVLVNNQIESFNFHSVSSDHAQGASMATEHLINFGHRRIGFLEILKSNWGARERERGFRDAFRKKGLEVPNDLIRYTDEKPAIEALEPLLKAKPTALLVCGEDLSLEVNRILIHELKVRIPEDLSVMTYETPLVSALLSPPQTTIAQPWEDIGRVAVETVISLVQGKTREKVNALLPNRLIERSSVRAI